MPQFNWITAAVGAVAGIALTWLVHLVILSGVEAAHRTALADQKTALEKSCADDKAITKGVSDELQTKNTALSKQLAALKRVQPARCIVPAPQPTSGGDGSAGGAKLAGSDGISTEWLYDFAGESEKYRIQLMACQSFIRQTWQAKGQVP